MQVMTLGKCLGLRCSWRRIHVEIDWFLTVDNGDTGVLRLCRVKEHAAFPSALAPAHEKHGDSRAPWLAAAFGNRVCVMSVFSGTG